MFSLHLVDGTYELFRAYYGAPVARAPDGREVGATRGLLRSLLRLVSADGATHVACAFDHVVESFRNDLFDGYKTGDGLPAEIVEQFPLAERAARALGMTVWPMVTFEADDALAAGAARWRDDARIDRVFLCSPDKDFAQCVRGRKVMLLDRRRESVTDEDGVWRRFGVAPASIPDWLALVGDTSDGIPGLRGWGKKTSAVVLGRYTHLEGIPRDAGAWEPPVPGAARLASVLRENWDDALLYRTLATLREDVPLEEDLDALAWRGARREELSALCDELGDPGFLERVRRWR
jgi:5'-3' exonuclease